ncbi:hypothetical protein L2E82_41024 [Cichorium intybus]|uniref:Uncharacterized protein n=1 Tax=Cichorium intybus TaxID=13427 RepID=A0ACB9ALP1_CICIN|nr:hypothetical protein L2E82_41024 [Cichorium intybus]
MPQHFEYDSKRDYRSTCSFCGRFILRHKDKYFTALLYDFKRFTLYTRSPISIEAPFKLSPILDEATSMVYMRSTMILSF